MPYARNGDTSLYYKTEGDRDREPLVLIAGLGSQLLAWPPKLREGLLNRNFYLIRFDNRDVGRSTWFDRPLVRATAGPISTAGGSYLLSDMAKDVVAILDHVGVESAHVVGVSMGGMIAQTVAIEHRRRVRRLVSVMSTTGDPTVGQPKTEVAWVLNRPRLEDRSAAIAQGIAVSQALRSRSFPFDEAAVAAHLAAEYDRGYHPEGRARQLEAIQASGDRTSGLADLDVPTLVIHGDEDPLIDVSGGRATAEAIPGADLHVIPRMAHDLPVSLLDHLINLIAAIP